MNYLYDVPEGLWHPGHRPALGGVNGWVSWRAMLSHRRWVRSAVGQEPPKQRKKGGQVGENTHLPP
jgi:hypothetical protein